MPVWTKVAWASYARVCAASFALWPCCAIQDIGSS